MKKKIIKGSLAALFAGFGYFLGDSLFSIMKESGVFITGKTWALLFLGIPIICSIIGFAIADFYFFTRRR